MFRTATIVGVVAASAATALAGPVADAGGDAVPVFGDHTTLLDIDTLEVRYDATEILVTMTFHTPIAAPSADRHNSVLGVIELDTDQDPSTGEHAVQNIYAPPFAEVGLGVDFVCDLFSEVAHPGFIEITDGFPHQPVATVPITFTEDSFRFAVPLEALGDDGLLDFTATVGVFEQPTDAMDRVGRSVPAPASLSLAALAGLIGARRRR